MEGTSETTEGANSTEAAIEAISDAAVLEAVSDAVALDLASAAINRGGVPSWKMESRRSKRAFCAMSCFSRVWSLKCNVLQAICGIAWRRVVGPHSTPMPSCGAVAQLHSNQITSAPSKLVQSLDAGRRFGYSLRWRTSAAEPLRNGPAAHNSPFPPLYGAPHVVRGTPQQEFATIPWHRLWRGPWHTRGAVRTAGCRTPPSDHPHGAVTQQQHTPYPLKCA